MRTLHAADKEAHAHLSQSKGAVIGAYEAPALLDQTSPSPTTCALVSKIAQRADKPSAIALLVRAFFLTPRSQQVDGNRILQEEQSALIPYAVATKKDPAKLPPATVASYSTLRTTVKTEIDAAAFDAIADFDEHLEDARRDWLTNAPLQSAT